ncbi:uncharacterized protein N7484_010917 [Penicillium longicatenatum]|uniref:uncharacterized protein n=1 Tax=Penicillium longicatenatum TaxID=1561947 RepID=UPI0025488A3A|nr:uncharacterized protein N7484_010917 [Penicillium longicatenatum]KAJ5630817.1 hypothetical protein N7484_010917 [Penicillium longicatenatum]
MQFLGLSKLLQLSIGIVVAMSAIGGESMRIPRNAARSDLARRSSYSSDCSRTCMTNIVQGIIDSMVVHNPSMLPLAPMYKATENSHPAAVTMMTAWRTITEAGEPSLLAIDTTNGTAYFALDVSEGDDAKETVLRGRIKVVDRLITELELFMNRNRGDHGFSYSAAELPTNYATLMSPPTNRTKASRDYLYNLSDALFSSTNSLAVSVADDCQFTELGWKVVDTGTWGNASSDPLGCSWPDDHPTDDNARVALVVDEELGFVVTSGIIPGTVYPYQNVSAFIPNRMASSQEAQEVWLKATEAEAEITMVAPFGATGDTLEVLQYYDGKLQAMQINVYLSGPNMTSPWL